MIILLIAIVQSIHLNFIPETKTPPSARSKAFMDYLEPRKSLIVFGGFDGSVLMNDIWEFSIESLTWNEVLSLSTDKPSNI